MKKSKNTTKFAILGLLTISPLSGYGIRSIIKTSISYFWSESNGQLYPNLNQLLKEGLITTEQEKGKGKKSPIIYSITLSGREALKTWLQDPEEKVVHRDENLLKLFFGSNLPKTYSIERLLARSKKLKKEIHDYQNIQKFIQTKVDSLHYLYWQISLNNGIMLAKADLKWCLDSIKLLKKTTEKKS